MNKSIFGITLVVILSYGQMSWAGDPAACISGLKTDESNNQIAIFFPRHVTASKTSVSVNDADITGLCEFMTDDGTDEIRCKLHFSQHPIAHIAGSPHDFFVVWLAVNATQSPSILTSGCVISDANHKGGIINPGGNIVANVLDGAAPTSPSPAASCTHSNIDTFVTCPPPPAPAYSTIDGPAHPMALRVKFSVPFE